MKIQDSAFDQNPHNDTYYHMEMETDDKPDATLNILGRIYTLFDRAMAPFSVACTKQCADCCTCNVAATGLEVAYIQHRLESRAVADMCARLNRAGQTRRFRPCQTTNEFALVCMSGRVTDAQENDPSWGTCPLLENGICTIYPVRPLGCRVMVSTTPCQQTGQADMPLLALTITTIFMQFVEHLDAEGIYGNFLDLLAYAEQGTLGDKKFSGSGKYLETSRNVRIPVLMIPPEHVTRTQELVHALRKIVV